MQMALFLANKIKRQLQLNGIDLAFVHHGLDEYGQVSDDATGSVVVRGLFHTTNSFVSGTDSENARLSSKPQPMVLALYDEGKEVQKDDTVQIRENAYKVVKKNDVNNLGIALDISLELLDG